jgi:hypothetical protein
MISDKLLVAYLFGIPFGILAALLDSLCFAVYEVIVSDIERNHAYSFFLHLSYAIFSIVIGVAICFFGYRLLPWVLGDVG